MVDFIGYWSGKTDTPIKRFLSWIGLSACQYHRWKARYHQPNAHNSLIPKAFWLLDWEKQAIIEFYFQHPEEGYRRLSYRMLDEDVVAVSASSVYRQLKFSGLLAASTKTPSKKGKGFDQPDYPHQHWHVDVTYINICGTFYYLCALLDGYSRYIVHFEIREKMTESDIEIIIQRGKEQFPNVHPRIISDNGPQFIAKEFKAFIKLSGMTHVRTSPFYPQSNGKIERWNGSLKRECIRPKTPTSLAEARQVVSQFVADYNHRRLHSAIGYIAPADKLHGRHIQIFHDRKCKLAQARFHRAKIAFHDVKQVANL